MAGYIVYVHLRTLVYIYFFIILGTVEKQKCVYNIVQVVCMCVI